MTCDSKIYLLTYKYFYHFYACIQNQIIHKRVQLDYSPLKGMLRLISSLKLLIVQLYPMQLVQKVEVTRGQHLPIYQCQTPAQVSLFVGFLISWISLQPTHENDENWYLTNKSDFTVLCLLNDTLNKCFKLYHGKSVQPEKTTNFPQLH